MYTYLFSIHVDVSMAQVRFDFYNLLCLGDVMPEGSVILNRASWFKREWLIYFYHATSLSHVCDPRHCGWLILSAGVRRVRAS